MVLVVAVSLSLTRTRAHTPFSPFPLLFPTWKIPAQTPHDHQTAKTGLSRVSPLSHEADKSVNIASVFKKWTMFRIWWYPRDHLHPGGRLRSPHNSYDHSLRVLSRQQKPKRTRSSLLTQPSQKKSQSSLTALSQVRLNSGILVYDEPTSVLC